MPKRIARKLSRGQETGTKSSARPQNRDCTAGEYKYDVAFSFMEADEELALHLDDLIRDRLKTFVYSRKQETVAGTDGEETFNRVFGSESRVVVVLYREGWGKTPWTRIEETAIRNRAYNEGYDFVLFIPLEYPVHLPPWLPKTQMWIGLDRWGPGGAAGVIEARVQQAGGTPHQETALDHAQRLARRVASEKNRIEFLHSAAGVEGAHHERAQLLHELKTKAEEISSHASPIQLPVDQKRDVFRIVLGGFSLVIAWSQQWVNSLEHSRLGVTPWRGLAPLPGGIPFEDPQTLKSREFTLDRNMAGQVGWREAKRETRFFTTGQLAEECLKMLLDCIGPRPRRSPGN